MATNEKAAKKVVTPKAGAQRKNHRAGTIKRGYRPTSEKPPTPSSDSGVTPPDKKD